MIEEAVREGELHAYVDGELDRERVLQLLARLETDAEAAASVSAYREQTSLLHAAFDPVLTEAVPARLERRARLRRPLARAATAMSWLAAGALIGWGIRDLRDPPAGPSLPRHAAAAHAVFVPEVRHPVEVQAADEKHLVGWLSKRLGTRIRVPSLGAHGFELLGGRLLPESERPGAQFMYEDAAGRRLTLYLSTDVANRDSAFRYSREGRVHVFYWIDRDIGYALSGELEKAEMLAVARTVYEQLNP